MCRVIEFATFQVDGFSQFKDLREARDGTFDPRLTELLVRHGQDPEFQYMPGGSEVLGQVKGRPSAGQEGGGEGAIRVLGVLGHLDGLLDAVISQFPGTC